MRRTCGEALILLFILQGCSGGSGTTGDAHSDALADAPDVTGPDAGEDPSPDAAADPGSDAAADPAADALPETTTDPGAEPPVDPGADPSCSDPCYVDDGYVTGCTADCGGFAGTPCPDTAVLTCVHASGSDAGICIPTVNLGCSVDGDCACFPGMSICTTTRWSCSGGSCAPACT